MKKGTMALILASMAAAACAEKAVESQPVKAAGIQAEAAKEGLWLTDFAAAVEKAKTEKKFLLVDFSGSDWCGWCMKLDKEVFSQKAFLEFAEANLVLVVLDFPQRKPQTDAIQAQNKKLMERYKVQGFPTVLVLDSDGKLVETTGYRPGGVDAYVAYLKGILEKERLKNVKN